MKGAPAKQYSDQLGFNIDNIETVKESSNNASIDTKNLKRKVQTVGSPMKKKAATAKAQPPAAAPTSTKVTALAVSADTAGGARRKDRKNNREKQRRSELNDKFDKLSQILNLGRKIKTEKFAILSEAINSILNLRSENSELKAEKAELRSELAKLTSCLQHAFPGQALPSDSRFQFQSDTGMEALTAGPPPTFGMTQSLGPEQQHFEPASVMAVPAYNAQGVVQAAGSVAQMNGGSAPFGMNANMAGMQDDFDLFV